MRLNWGTGIAVVYGIFASATLGFSVYAMQQRVDLVSDHYYAQSLDHDRHMAAVGNAAMLGRAFVCDVSDDGREVTLGWPADRAGGLDGTLTYYRPSDAAIDRTIRLAPDAAGHQQVSLAGLPAGRWILQIAWTQGGRPYYVERAVNVR